VLVLVLDSLARPLASAKAARFTFLSSWAKACP